MHACRCSVLFLIVLFALGGCGSGGGSGGGAVDLGVGFNHVRGPNGAVNSIAPANDGSGKVYLGGDFTIYSNTAANRIARLNPDGSVDTTFVTTSGFDGAVSSIAPATDGSGDVYVGGSFTSYNGTPANRIVRLNADGSIDTAFVTTSGFDNTVLSIAPANDGSGDIYVGGDFSLYRGNTANHIARVNADGSFDAGFVTTTGFNSRVRSIAPALDGSGRVYVGGSFTLYRGNTVIGIVRLIPNGALDTSFAVTPGLSGTVNSVAPANDGTDSVYAGGTFVICGPGPGCLLRNQVVLLDISGNLDPGFNTSFAGDVKTVVAATDGSGDIYVGGNLAALALGSVMRLNADGTADAGFAIGSTDVSAEVNTVALAADGSGDVYVSGSFTSYGGKAANRVARLDANGTVDAGFAIGTGFNGGVSSIAPATDGSGDVYVGGSFTSYNGTPANRIVRLNADGSIDTAFVTTSGFDNTVLSIAPANDGSGDIYVGGDFSLYRGNTANHIARVNADGSFDAGFVTTTGFNSQVRSIAPALDGSGRVYVGGNFTIYRGNTANRIARLNADGSFDAGFVTTTGFNIQVRSIAPANDGSGDIYAGGDFTLYRGNTANHIARVNADGSFDTGFVTGAGSDFYVSIIAPANDGSGDTYVGGNFLSYNGTPANHIVRLNADGSIDTGFVTTSGFNNVVWSIAPALDGSGRVYVGGQFGLYRGNTANRVARVNPDGSFDSGFVTGAGFSNSVESIAPASDGSGDIFMGGNFLQYNTTLVDRMVRLDPDGTVD